MTFRSSIKRAWKQAHNAARVEQAVAASEYAALLAVLILTAIVSVTIFGNKMNHTVGNVDNQVSTVIGGGGGSESAVASGAKTGGGDGKSGEEDGGKGGGKDDDD